MLKLAADHMHLLLVLGQSRQVLEHIVAVLQVALHIMGQPVEDEKVNFFAEKYT